LEKKFLELTGERIEIPESVRDREELKKFLVEKMKEIYQRKEEFFGKGLMRELEKMITLQVLDMLWRRHLHHLDRLREGIYLRGYAMRDPVTEFKKEAYQMFETFLNEFKYGALQSLFKVELAPQEEAQPTQPVGGGEEAASPIGLPQNQTAAGETQSVPQPMAERKPRTPKPRKLKDRLKERGKGLN
ncbi:MAG TPA: preprotein translocase subunit SecA, partial [Aquifex sp.]|nr:preprotein translocase subunit SecA [Aquifex sp.]